MPENEQGIDYISALRAEASRQLDVAIESGNALQHGQHSWYDDEGVRISRSEHSLTLAVEYEERTTAGKILDLTVGVEFTDYEGKQIVEVYEDRINPDTQETGRKNVARAKHQETAGKLLKVLSIVV